MKIENAELNEIPPPIEKILEFDVDDLHFRMMVTREINTLIHDPVATLLHPAYVISCLVEHKPMGTQLSLVSDTFTKEQTDDKWKELREKFVRQAISNKHLLAKSFNAIRMRV